MFLPAAISPTGLVMVKVVVVVLVVVAKTFVRFDSGKKERSERKVYKTKNVQHPQSIGQVK